MAVSLSSHTPTALYFPETFFVSVSSNHFCYRLSKLHGLVRPGGLVKLITNFYVARSRTRDLLAYNTMPQTLRYSVPPPL
jgi:hypothetical protein